MARASGHRHREAVRTSRSEELHARLAKHAKAVAAIEAERAALDVRARRDAACAWDGPSAANAVARAAFPPPPPPRHVEASPATLALVQAENERLRRRVAELDAPVGPREREAAGGAREGKTARRRARGGRRRAAKRIETLERAAAESTDEIARLTARVAELGAANATLEQRCAAGRRKLTDQARAAQVDAKKAADGRAAAAQNEAVAAKEINMLRQRIAELKSAAAVKAAETEGLRAAAAGENERLRRRLADLERQHAERQKRVGVLQTASMNASVENERLLQRLRAAEKPSLASAAESEKLGEADRAARVRFERGRREACARKRRAAPALRAARAAGADGRRGAGRRYVRTGRGDRREAGRADRAARRQYDALEKQPRRGFRPLRLTRMGRTNGGERLRRPGRMRPCKLAEPKIVACFPRA